MVLAFVNKACFIFLQAVGKALPSPFFPCPVKKKRPGRKEILLPELPFDRTVFVLLISGSCDVRSRGRHSGARRQRAHGRGDHSERPDYSRGSLRGVPGRRRPRLH